MVLFLFVVLVQTVSPFGINTSVCTNSFPAAQISFQRGGVGRGEAGAARPLGRCLGSPAGAGSPRCASIPQVCIGPVRGVRAPRGCWGPCWGAEHPAGAFPFAFRAASLWGRAGILGASDGNRRKSGFHLTPRVAPSRVSHAAVKRRGEANGASCGICSVRSLRAQQGQRLLARGLHCLRPAVRVRGARGSPAAGGSAAPSLPGGLDGHGQ